jgi:hypothetical protein
LSLESVETEEALGWALNTYPWRHLRDHPAIVLSAQYRRPASAEIKVPTTEFLAFSVAIAGNKMIGLYWRETFSPTVQFLVKRKKPQPKKDEE